MVDYQQAADDAGVIAETVETLARLMDKFCTDYPALGVQLEAAWPEGQHVELATAKKLYALSHRLTPPV